MPSAESLTGGHWPDCVPALADTDSGVTLRAHDERDLDAIVEQSNDPETQLWTTVPIPPGGYSRDDAREYLLGVIPRGWEDGSTASWAIDARRSGRLQYCGTIDLRIKGGQQSVGERFGEVGFALHPDARGKSVMSAALRLVVDYGFDVASLAAMRWLANVGNWPSRRVAEAAGFRFDGTVRKLLPQRGVLMDGWVATIAAADPRTPVPELAMPVLEGKRVRLRPFRESDAARIVEGCRDDRTRHWLVSLPWPYTQQTAVDYVHFSWEGRAAGRTMTYCVANPRSDECLGSIALEGFDSYARRGEIGYWAHPETRGRGVMTEAVRLLTSYAESSNVAGSIQLRCAAGNSASRHVAETNGYQHVGVLPRCEPLGDGNVADLVIYSRP